MTTDPLTPLILELEATVKKFADMVEAWPNPTEAERLKAEQEEADKKETE